MDVPFMAVGSDELGEDVNKGDVVKFGDMEGIVHYATNENGEETNMLCLINVESKNYLVGVNGKVLEGVTIVKKNEEEN